MLSNIKGEIKNILKGAGVDTEINLETPPDSEKGDLAFPCFEYAKKHNEDPTEIANHLADLADGVHGKGIFEDVKAMGPYVNFFLNLSDIADDVLSKVRKEKENYGFTNERQNQSVLIEYPSPNTHKRFHVGHLRNICMGNALRELYDRNDYKVSTVNYVNDFGFHVAKSLWGILNLYDGKIPEENTQEWLGKVYTEASKEIEQNEELKSEVETILKKITTQDQEIVDIFEKTKKVSLNKFDEIFEELDVDHEKIYFESDLKERGQEIVDELIVEEVAEEGEGGAIIVDLLDYDLGTALIRKSNGEGLYITSDLALAEQKHTEYPAVEESIYITGNEQEFHFKQLFKILDLHGFEQEMTHIGYGLVNLPEGKMSSREGNVVLYDDLKEELFEKLKAETEARHEDWSNEKIEKNAEKLTTAVAKFELQKHESHKNITFDIEQATNFEGYSAPYVLYVVARINSLERKAEVDLENINFDTFTQEEERELIIKISEFGEIVKNSLDNYNTSSITRYCFDLAQAFNNYYSEHSIIQNSNKELTKSRLALAVAVRQALENALEVLTIETLEEM